MIKTLNIDVLGIDAIYKTLVMTNEAVDAKIESSVKHILSRIQSEGDVALLEYARRFDGVTVDHPGALEVPKSMFESALDELDQELREALVVASERIRAYHLKQQEGAMKGDYRFLDSEGSEFWQVTAPLDSVGLYVPGGKAFYPSSVLMGGIPAKVAGVRQVIMAVPVGYSGQVAPVVLAAAGLAGVDRVFTVGGAQAIGALAFGTQTVPKVDKIVGPGNSYVACAKRMVFGEVGIDLIAGPSEILIIADQSLGVEQAVFDLFSQAEHDEMAQAVLMSTDQEFLDEVYAMISKLLPSQPRASVIQASLENRGALVKLESWQQAIDLSNRLAPEHLELVFNEVSDYLDQVKHAGSVFVGPYTTESFGDYCSGTNHVLPTSGAARFSSPLGVQDFQKRTSFTRCSQAGANMLGPIAATLARAEHLEAHARAAESRVPKKL